MPPHDFKICNKKFGNKIFSKLIEELKFLQENGITVSNEKNYFKVGLVSQDNLGIVLPELQRFYGRAIVIITPVEMPISDITDPCQSSFSFYTCQFTG
jgi:hypothetical protein